MLFALALTLSCQSQIQQERALVDYAQHLLSDRTSREAGLLSASQESRPEFDIAIIGESSECESLCEYLLSYDSHDNIDASHNPDQLPDFAGECFNQLVLSPAADTLEQRRLFVQSVVAAMDSLVCISPYDEQGVSGKKPSKLLILSNPAALKYGKYDADSLLRGYSSASKLISSLDLMLEQAFDARKGEDISLAIVCEPEYYGAQLYESLFEQKARQRSLLRSSCHLVASSQSDTLMRHIVDSYLQSGHERKLDAVIVDAYSVDVDMLKSELADLLSIMNASSMLYSHVFSPGFSILDARKTIAEYCYSHLRQYNLFTHNIALPQSQSFNCYPREGKTILIPSNYVQN